MHRDREMGHAARAQLTNPRSGGRSNSHLMPNLHCGGSDAKYHSLRTSPVHLSNDM